VFIIEICLFPYESREGTSKRVRCDLQLATCKVRSLMRKTRFRRQIAEPENLEVNYYELGYITCLSRDSTYHA